MELHEATVETQQSLTMPWQETLVMPIGDVQYGAEGCAVKDFRRDLDWGMKHGAYFLGMGDFLDVLSPSGRTKFKSAEFYDSAAKTMEDGARNQLDDMLRFMKGTENRWLGFHEGHHFFEFDDGQTSDTMMAKAMNAPFLGTCAITRLLFKRHGWSTRAVEIWSHHGVGSGVTMAAPLNKLERCMGRWRSARVFLVGHYHRAACYSVAPIMAHWDRVPELREEECILACTGGYLKGYQVGTQRAGRAKGSYIEQGMMPPTNLRGIVITFSPVHGKNEDHIGLGYIRLAR